MPLQDIVKKLEQKAAQSEINALIAVETDAKLDESTQKDFYQCFNLLVEQGYQDEAIMLARKYKYVGLDDYDFSSRSPFRAILLKKQNKLAEALIQSHLDQGGTLVDYRAKKMPLLSLVFRQERINEMDEEGCYNLAKFLINHGAAEDFIQWTGEKPASPYIAGDGASTLRMIKLLEEKGFKPTLKDMMPYSFGFYSTEDVNQNVDEDAIIYLFNKYFITGSRYDYSECPEAVEILKNAISNKQIKLVEFLLEKGVNPNMMRDLSLQEWMPPAIILLLKKHNYSGVTGEAGRSAILQTWTRTESRLSFSRYDEMDIDSLRFINTLLQCEVNVAPAELKNLASLDVPLLLEHGFYHLAYLVKPPLTPAEEKEYQILMKDSKPPVYYQSADKLKDAAAAREQTPDEIKSKAKGEEYIQTRLDVVESTGPFNPRQENGRDLYKKISEGDFWMLCVDGDQIKYGPTAYDGREYGSIRALQNAYQHMLTEFIDKPLTKDILKAMHKDISARVANLGLETFNTGGEFRKKDPVGFGLVDTTMTPKGLEEIKSMEAANGSFILQRMRPDGYRIQVKNLEDKEEGNIPALNHLVDQILEKYHKKIEEITAKEREGKEDPKLLDEEKLQAIVACIQELERTHPFSDANCRTFTLTLNLLLLQNGFCPTLLTDPNRMDGLDVASFVREIKQGMIHFRHLAEHARYPGQGTTKEILLQTKGKYPVIEFISDPKKMKELGLRLDERKGAIVRMPVLHWAVQFNYADKIDIVREFKYDMNSRDIFKNTALMIAAFNGNKEITQKLLNFPETKVELEGQFGLTAYDIARLQGHTEIAQSLIEHGAKPKDDAFYADKKDLLAKFGYDALFVKSPPAPTPALVVDQERKTSPATSMFASMNAVHLRAHASDESKKPFLKSPELPTTTPETTLDPRSTKKLTH